MRATVAGTNRVAASGRDRDFRRGETHYERFKGDPAHGPNPTLGPIGTVPFCTAKL